MSNKLSLYAQATRLSLKNAEQWIKDAKLLIENSSFGHASALLRFACEEIAKSYVCWFTSEKIWPAENKVVRDAFREHRVKNQVIIGLFYTLMWISNKNLHKEVTKGRLEPSDEEIIEAYEQFEELLDAMEKMRQKALYVDLKRKKKEVETPLMIGEKEATSLLKGAEAFLKIVRYYVEEFPETKKEILRKIFSSIPRQAWKTGELPIKSGLKRDKCPCIYSHAASVKLVRAQHRPRFSATF